MDRGLTSNILAFAFSPPFLLFFFLSFFSSFFFLVTFSFFFLFLFFFDIFPKKTSVDIQDATLDDLFTKRDKDLFIATLSCRIPMQRNMKEHTLLKIEMQCKKG